MSHAREQAIRERRDVWITFGDQVAVKVVPHIRYQDGPQRKILIGIPAHVRLPGTTEEVEVQVSCEGEDGDRMVVISPDGADASEAYLYDAGVIRVAGREHTYTVRWQGDPQETADQIVAWLRDHNVQRDHGLQGLREDGRLEALMNAIRSGGWRRR